MSLHYPPLVSGRGEDVVHDGGDVPLPHLPPSEPPVLTMGLIRIQSLGSKALMQVKQLDKAATSTAQSF